MQRKKIYSNSAANSLTIALFFLAVLILYSFIFNSTSCSMNLLARLVFTNLFSVPPLYTTLYTSCNSVSLYTDTILYIFMYLSLIDCLLDTFFLATAFFFATFLAFTFLATFFLATGVPAVELLIYLFNLACKLVNAYNLAFDISYCSKLNLINCFTDLIPNKLTISAKAFLCVCTAPFNTISYAFVLLFTKVFMFVVNLLLICLYFIFKEIILVTGPN